MKNKENSAQGTLIVVLLFIIALVLSYRLFAPVQQDDTRLLLYLDSVNKKNELLFAKVDSLQKVKTQLYKEYRKAKLKYDTIQIAIDTMPDLEGTKLLFSISRQLTAKGVE